MYHYISLYSFCKMRNKNYSYGIAIIMAFIMLSCIYLFACEIFIESFLKLLPGKLVTIFPKQCYFTCYHIVIFFRYLTIIGAQVCTNSQKHTHTHTHTLRPRHHATTLIDLAEEIEGRNISFFGGLNGHTTKIKVANLSPPSRWWWR